MKRITIDLSDTVSLNGAVYVRAIIEGGAVASGNRMQKKSRKFVKALGSRRWTPEEDARLLKYAGSHWSFQEIAGEFNRTLIAVKNRFLELQKKGVTQ